MADQNDQDEDTREHSSWTTRIAKSVVGPWNQEASDRLEDGLDELVPNASGELIDSFFSSGAVGAANEIAFARGDAELREQGRHPDDAPVVETRDKVLEDGRTATWIWVSDPDVDILLAQTYVLLRKNEWTREIPLSYTPGEVEQVKDDTIGEFIVAPEPTPEPEAEPEPEEESDNYYDYLTSITDDEDDDG